MLSLLKLQLSLVLFLATFWVFATDVKDEITLTFVRHGETNCNNQKIVQGQANTSLNLLGMLQAQLLKDKLQTDQEYDLCYSSDTLRAKQTAILLSKLCVNDKIVLDSRLRERNAGVWEGKSLHEYKCYREEDGNGIESDSEMKDRIFEFLNELLEKYEGKEILIVTHGGVLRNIVSLLDNVATLKVTVDNTAFLKVKFSINGLRKLFSEGIFSES